MEALDLHAKLVRKNSIEHDANDSCYGETREMDAADGNTVACSVLHTYSEHKDEGRNKDIARI